MPHRESLGLTTLSDLAQGAAKRLSFSKARATRSRQASCAYNNNAPVLRIWGNIGRTIKTSILTKKHDKLYKLKRFVLIMNQFPTK